MPKLSKHGLLLAREQIAIASEIWQAKQHSVDSTKSPTDKLHNPVCLEELRKTIENEAEDWYYKDSLMPSQSKSNANTASVKTESSNFAAVSDSEKKNDQEEDANKVNFPYTPGRKPYPSPELSTAPFYHPHFAHQAYFSRGDEALNNFNSQFGSGQKPDEEAMLDRKKEDSSKWTLNEDTPNINPHLNTNTLLALSSSQNQEVKSLNYQTNDPKIITPILQHHQKSFQSESSERQKSEVNSSNPHSEYNPFQRKVLDGTNFAENNFKAHSVVTNTSKNNLTAENQERLIHPYLRQYFKLEENAKPPADNTNAYKPFMYRYSSENESGETPRQVPGYSDGYSNYHQEKQAQEKHSDQSSKSTSKKDSPEQEDWTFKPTPASSSFTINNTAMSSVPLQATSATNSLNDARSDISDPWCNYIKPSEEDDMMQTRVQSGTVFEEGNNFDEINRQASRMLHPYLAVNASHNMSSYGSATQDSSYMEHNPNLSDDEYSSCNENQNEDYSNYRERQMYDQSGHVDENYQKDRINYFTSRDPNEYDSAEPHEEDAQRTQGTPSWVPHASTAENEDTQQSGEYQQQRNPTSPSSQYNVGAVPAGLSYLSTHLYNQEKQSSNTPASSQYSNEGATRTPSYGSQYSQATPSGDTSSRSQYNVGGQSAITNNLFSQNRTEALPTSATNFGYPTNSGALPISATNLNSQYTAGAPPTGATNFNNPYNSGGLPINATNFQQPSHNVGALNMNPTSFGTQYHAGSQPNSGTNFSPYNAGTFPMGMASSTPQYNTAAPPTYLNYSAPYQPMPMSYPSTMSTPNMLRPSIENATEHRQSIATDSSSKALETPRTGRKSFMDKFLNILFGEEKEDVKNVPLSSDERARAEAPKYQQNYMIESQSPRQQPGAYPYFYPQQYPSAPNPMMPATMVPSPTMQAAMVPRRTSVPTVFQSTTSVHSMEEPKKPEPGNAQEMTLPYELQRRYFGRAVKPTPDLSFPKRSRRPYDS